MVRELSGWAGFVSWRSKDIICNIRNTLSKFKFCGGGESVDDIVDEDMWEDLPPIENKKSSKACPEQMLVSGEYKWMNYGEEYDTFLKGWL